MLEVTIPVLNEEKTLEKNTLIAYNYIKSQVTTNFKIVIVNNGSTDKTDEIARKLKKEYIEIDYIELPTKGVGLALKTSWLRSKADIIGYMDLDLATDLSHLTEAYFLLNQNQYEIVNGSRLLSDSKVTGRSWVRNLTSQSFNTIVRLLLGVSLSDGMCGFKFFKREVAVELIRSGIEVDGWFFSTEILVRSIWAGKKLIEIPVKWTDDSESKVKIIKLSKEYFLEILRLRKERNKIINS